ncbi:MAG: acyl-ACP--UDP-N-acetylglucosamine O-acyltransferase [Ignavibacteriaceae bacterium]
MSLIHPTSVIDPETEIAEDVEIGPFCFIEKDVKIGKGTRLLNHVTLYNGSRLGENNLVYPGAVISGIPQDLKYKGQYSEVFIGNDNTIRECVTISKATVEPFKTIIGNDCLLMAYSHVAHDCVLGNKCILANSVALGGHVTLGEYAICGGLVGVHQFVKIGMHCMIGAHSMIVKDVAPYGLFSGDPLKYSGLNTVGLKRRKFSPDTIELLKKALNLIFISDLNVSQAVEKIVNELPHTEELKNLVNFILKSKRGISK